MKKVAHIFFWLIDLAKVSHKTLEKISLKVDIDVTIIVKMKTKSCYNNLLNCPGCAAFVSSMRCCV